MKIQAAFFSPLDLRENGDGTYTLLSMLSYWSAKVELWIEVPAGFVTDFYSVPRFLQRLVAASQRSNAPAVIHDYLFHTCGLNGRLTLGECNAVLAEAMLVKEVPWWTRTKINSGVALGSWVAWRNCNK